MSDAQPILQPEVLGRVEARQSEVATAARKSADAESLYQLCVDLMRERRDLVRVVGTIARTYSERERPTFGGDGLAAMERVARDALGLAGKLVDLLGAGGKP